MPGAFKNPYSDFCYLVTNHTYLTQCKGRAEPLIFYNDDEVKGFIKLLDNKTIEIPQSGINLQAWRNEKDEFAFNGNYLSINESFNNLMIVNDDLKHSCVKAKYFNGSNVLELYSFDCPYEKSGIVCMHIANNAGNCTKRRKRQNGGDYEYQNPLDLMMNPGLKHQLDIAVGHKRNQIKGQFKKVRLL